MEAVNPTIAATEQLIVYLHRHQQDWEGDSYHLHPMAVRDNLRTIPVYWKLTPEQQVIADHVALLHDTIEDVKLDEVTGEPTTEPNGREMTEDDLLRFGYTTEVTRRVAALSRNLKRATLGHARITYLDEIAAIVAGGDVIEMLVKLADNLHNADERRMKRLPAARRETAEKLVRKRYRPSMKLLRAGLGLDE